MGEREVGPTEEEQELLDKSVLLVLVNKTKVLALDFTTGVDTYPQAEVFDLETLITDRLIDNYAERLKKIRSEGIETVRDEYRIFERTALTGVISRLTEKRPDVNYFPPPTVAGFSGNWREYLKSPYWDSIKTKIDKVGGDYMLRDLDRIIPILLASDPPEDKITSKVLRNIPNSIQWKNPNL